MSKPTTFRLNPIGEENLAVIRHFQPGLDQTAAIHAALQLYAEMSAETGAVLAARREIRKANRAEMIKSVDGMIKRAAKKSVKARKS